MAQLANHKEQMHAAEKRRCDYREFCSYGQQCRNGIHTAEEMSIFKSRGGQGYQESAAEDKGLYNTR
jgi:hypothetical protein